jgi:hypothetical protein
MHTQLARPPSRQQSPFRGVTAAEDQTDILKAAPAQQSSPETSVPPALPFAALNHLFVFTSGAKQSVWESPIADQKFKQWVGQDLDTVRQGVPRDVVFNCDPVGLLGSNGNLSDAVWRLISARRPALVEKQRQGGCCLSVRTFRIESGSVVALALFYDAEKLGQEPR